jgi:hypothetical protein
MAASTQSDGPRLVLTVGVHGSASTWVFNVVRELMVAACGVNAVAACYAARPEDLAAASATDARVLVGKTHGWPGLETFARERGAVVIVSIRDPRDAVFSLMQRFGDTLDVAVSGVARDFQCARRCALAGHPLLRYEDRFFDDPATVRRIATHIGAAVTEATLAAIFAQYRTDAVRAIAAGVRALPAEQRLGDGLRLFVDRHTLITHGHIGDGRIGKWRELANPELRGQLTQFFAPFLFRYGYDLD